MYESLFLSKKPILHHRATKRLFESATIQSGISLWRTTKKEKVQEGENGNVTCQRFSVVSVDTFPLPSVIRNTFHVIWPRCNLLDRANYAAKNPWQRDTSTLRHACARRYSDRYSQSSIPICPISYLAGLTFLFVEKKNYTKSAEKRNEGGNNERSRKMAVARRVVSALSLDTFTFRTHVFTGVCLRNVKREDFP